MRLLGFIWANARRMMLAATLAALLSGACNAGLIALVNVALNAKGQPALTVAWAFLALGAAKILTHFLSQAMLASFSQGAIASLRRDLIRKVLAVPLQQLEELGTPRVLVALTDDVFNITQALLGLPLAFVNLAILLGGAAYLGWLSWKVLAGLLGLIVAGAAGYRFIVANAFHRLNLAREAEDKLFRSFRALTDGLKELKLHRRRREAFLKENIQTTTEIYQRHNVAAEIRFIASQSWSHLLYFALIGVVIFALPRLGSFTRETLTGYVLTSLYLMGPLAGPLSSGSLFSQAELALQKVEELGVSLTERSAEECPTHAPEPDRTFEQLELVDVVHSYHREQEDDSFVLGPISLRFQPSELVFLVGGNGSGKSTLAKIITGLYLPRAQDPIRENSLPSLFLWREYMYMNILLL
jgi:putative ATP-binding cassette transporter